MHGNKLLHLSNGTLIYGVIRCCQSIGLCHYIIDCNISQNGTLIYGVLPMSCRSEGQINYLLITLLSYCARGVSPSLFAYPRKWLQFAGGERGVLDFLVLAVSSLHITCFGFRAASGLTNAKRFVYHHDHV